MAYRNKVYVSFDADSDIRYYYLMKAWKQGDNTSFNFYDAHDVNNNYDKNEECADLVRKSEAFYFDSKGKVKDKFPKENRNTNHVCHVSPHVRVGLDHYVLPVVDKQTGITSYTKQSFWFNKDFVEKILNEKI